MLKSKKINFGNWFDKSDNKVDQLKNDADKKSMKLKIKLNLPNLISSIGIPKS